MTEFLLSDEMSPDGNPHLFCQVCESNAWGVLEFSYTDDETGRRETFRICVNCYTRAGEVIKAGLATEDERE